MIQFCKIAAVLLTVLPVMAGEMEKPSPIRTRTTTMSVPDLVKAPSAVPSNDQGPNTGRACYFESPKAMTAVHASYPIGARVKVTNLANNKSVVVTVSGHSALVGRLISVSKDAADQLGYVASGTTMARVQLVP